MVNQLESRTIDRVREFILEKAEAPAEAARRDSDPFWKGLAALGTELWLDTGDIEAARRLWTAEFSGLTTNNTLLNREVQKGIYDAVIREADGLLKDLQPAQRVVEIAFILNALHGLRLVKTFRARVSVELHTATAHDAEAAAAYGRRFAAISPDRFIVKVPLTAAGLIATRALRLEGIPVNFTLGFSARQNHLASAFAFPSYVNVFLGRLNSYLADNALGDGRLAGERATLASQREVREVSRRTGRRTLQIAASFREAGQVPSLAGVDVMTVPVGTAAEAREKLAGLWASRVDEDYRVNLAPGVDEKALRLSVTWQVTEREKELGASLADDPPRTSAELVHRAKALGVADLFPDLSTAELQRISSDGKIPKHAAWAARVARGELAVDTLLNLAGLASFTADQQALDDRVRGLMGEG